MSFVTNGNDDVLGSFMHVRHWDASCNAGQFHGMDQLARLFIERLQDRVSDQVPVHSGEQECLRNQHTGKDRLAGLRNLQAQKCWVILYLLRRLAVGNHPKMLSRVQIDRCDSSPGRLDQRQPLRSLQYVY